MTGNTLPMKRDSILSAGAEQHNFPAEGERKEKDLEIDPIAMHGAL